MPYPQSFIDDLKRKVDIVRVVQDYIQLKKKGSNWMACCPFHKEDTPSFSVSPAREIFYCFGCQKGGNIFTFVMEMERCSFPEAIKLIASKAGAQLPALDPRSEVRQERASNIIELNALALEWWVAQMESIEAKAAREYLVSRGVTDETTNLFQIGYAPNSWEGLLNRLRKEGADPGLIEQSGLVVTKPEGGYYDRFRGRLMIPVFDMQKRPIAFNGRTLIGDQAKYVNSPETPVFVKGKNLFGLHLTREEIRKKGFSILVEGAFDLIIPYQHGIRNIAASLGTSFTEAQAETLVRFANKVVVNYDGDNAGISATKKALEHLLAQDMEVKVLVLPDSDPDEFIRTRGVGEYKRLRTAAPTHMQFVIDLALRNRNMSRPSDKAAAVEEVLPFIKAINSRVQKREYFDIAMNSLRVNDEALRKELWISLRQDGPLGSIKMKASAPSLAERRLLEVLLNDSVVRKGVCPKLNNYDLTCLHTYDIFRAVIALEAAGLEPDFDTLSKLLANDAGLIEMLPQLFFALLPADPAGEAQGCLDAIWLLSTSPQLDALRVQMKAADEAGEADKRDALAQQHLALVRRRNEVLRSRSRLNRMETL